MNLQLPSFVILASTSLFQDSLYTDWWKQLSESCEKILRIVGKLSKWVFYKTFEHYRFENRNFYLLHWFWDRYLVKVLKGDLYVLFFGQFFTMWPLCGGWLPWRGDIEESKAFYQNQNILLNSLSYNY